MALSLQTLLEAPIIELDTIDSTNNYAMRLIDADTAQPGLTILANAQTQGKGQRGNAWQDVPGESVLMSLVCVPECALEDQFVFNSAVAVAIAETLTSIYEHWDVRIKWPNDIILNDKKAGGILIENILRGNGWSYSIIGLGLNVSQSAFPPALPFATSLTAASGHYFDRNQVFSLIRTNILTRLFAGFDKRKIMKDYNDFLYRKNKRQKFTNGLEEWMAAVSGVGPDGRLQVRQPDGSIHHYDHGSTRWKWD